MQTFTRLSCYVALAISLSGCGTGQTRSLQSQLAELQAEQERLQQENANLLAELRETQTKLESANQQLADSSQILEQLGPSRDLLLDLVEKYSAGLQVAKDLGLTELQNTSVEDLLNQFRSLSGEGENDEQNNNNLLNN